MLIVFRLLSVLFAMFVVVFLGVLFTMLVFLFGLHAFHDFFFLDAVTQSLHQVQLHAASLRGCLKGLLDPFVGFPTHIHNHVGTCDGGNILCRRLVAVQIRAVLDKQLKVYRTQAVSQDIFQPIVLRINCRYDGYLFIFRILLSRFQTATNEQEYCR